MRNFQIVAKNTFALTAVEFVSKIVAIFWIIFLARALGVESFGKYNFVNAFILIFSVLPDLGIGLVFVREVAQNQPLAKEYLGNCLVLNSILSVVAFIFIFLTINILHYSFSTVILVAIATGTLIISTIRSVGSWMFEAHEKMEISAMLTCLNTLVTLLGGFVFWQIGKSLSFLFFGLMTGTIISTLITWSFVIKAFGWPKLRLNVKMSKYLIEQGFPLALAAFAYYLYTKIDTVILSKIADNQAIGWYNAATIFSFSAIQFLNVPLVSAIYPTLSRLLAADYQNLSKIIQKLLLMVILWSVPFAVFVTIFSSFLINLVYGPAYFPAVNVLKIVVWFTPFAALSAFLYKFLIILKKQKIYLYVSLVGSVTNILLNLVAIPKFGMIGAATSSVLTQVLLLGIYVVILRKYVNPIFSFYAITKEDVASMKQTLNSWLAWLNKRQ